MLERARVRKKRKRSAKSIIIRHNNKMMKNSKEIMNRAKKLIKNLIKKYKKNN